MSSWNDQFKTHILTANIFNQNRAIFKLDEGKVFSGDIRLSNLSCLTTEDNTQSPATMGLWNLIRSITLYNDNEVLASLENVGPYMGFKNMLESNDAEVSLKTIDNCSGWGFTIDRAVNHSERVSRTPKNCYNTFSTALAVLQPEASLRLSKALPFLDAIKFIDTNVFKKLRLEIEWNTSAQFVNADGVLGTPGTASTLASIVQPTLVLQELINEKALQSLPKEQSVSYLNVIDERFNVANSGADDTIQNVTQRLRRFNNKFLNRVLVCSSIANVTNGLTQHNSQNKNAHSIGFRNEQINFQVNNIPLLKENGVDTASSKLAMCNDVWGQFCTPASAHSQIISTYNNVYDSEASAFYQTSYGGFQIGERITSLDINFQRQSNPTAYTPSTGSGIEIDRTNFEMQVYGEVAMVVSYDKAGNIKIFE
jgi:hypothetical protein